MAHPWKERVQKSSAGGLLERGGTALHDVVGSIKMVRFLLSAGADIHARNTKGQTTLHLAALQHVHQSVFRALLEAGAEIDARDKRGLTPLMTLFQSGAEPENARPLMQFLMSQGADLEARDTHGGNARWHARGSGLESLLSAEGLTLEIPDDAYVGNLRRDLDTAITIDDKPKFAELVDRIGELSSEEAYRVLEGAVLSYRADFVEALAESGVDVNRRNREGYTVLEIEKICREGPQSEESKRVIKVLERFGKAGSQEEKRQTEAAMAFYKEYVQRLSQATAVDELQSYRTAEAPLLSEENLRYLHELHTTVPIERIKGGTDTVTIYRRREGHPGLDVILVNEAGTWKIAKESLFD